MVQARILQGLGMPQAFDPDRQRLALDGHSCLSQARALASGPINFFFWGSALGEVVVAHLVGRGEDPARAELLALVRATLRPALTTGELAPATADDAYDVARALTTLALADWIAEGTPQPARFAEAHATMRRCFDLTYARKKPSMEHGVLPVVELACAASRFDEAKRFLAAVTPDKAYDPTKARTIAELTLALAEGTASAALAERFLRANLAGALERGGHVDAALQLYCASLAGLPGEPRALLAEATRFVRYLAAPKTPASPRKPKPRVAPAPALDHPRPPRWISAAEPWPDATQVFWKRVDGGWAVRLLDFALVHRQPLFASRAADVLELTGSLVRPSAAKLPRLVRAPLDGAALSALARSPEPVALEVAIAPDVDNWVDGRMVSSPARLVRKDLRDALEVGALTRLRALAWDATETDKERLARGDRPYPLAPEWLWTSRLAAQLEAVEVQASPHDLATWLPVLDALPRLREILLCVWLRDGAACFALDRRDDGLHAVLQSFRAPTSAAWAGLLDTALSPAFLDRLRSLDVAIRVAEIDEASVRRFLEPRVRVDRVRTGVPRREL